MRLLKLAISLSLLALAFGISSARAEDRKRLGKLEAEIEEKLASLQQVEFYEIFFSLTGPEHREALQAEIRDLFRDHFGSGIGEIEVWPLKKDDLHREVLGEYKGDVLHRAPGPPFAYLEVYPADENDPTYMGLNFRVARIDGALRIVFPEARPGLPQFLEKSASRWKRSDGTEFEGRLVTVTEKRAYFERGGNQVVSIPIRELGKSDQERLGQIQESTSIR